MSDVTFELPAPTNGLAQSFTGRIVRPADGDYDALRGVALGGIDRRPALILRPRTAADVAAAVRFAAETGAPLSVRSGGHSGAGHGVNDAGIVIDMRDMKVLEVDEATGTAWVETGLTAGEVSAAVTERGLVVGFGDAATVGIGGITTGGGVGYLSRKYGLTIDSVLAAELVTADGQIHMLDATHEPDLFWAVRGGGGNFGVVTRFRFLLRPLNHFTGGMMVLPATAETIDGFVAAAAAAPRELGTIANVMPAPPMPFLKPEDHGKPVILAMLAFAGDEDAARAALAPFRALATPLADMVRPGSYMQMFPPEDPNYKPIAVMRNMYLDAVEPGPGRTIMEHLQQPPGGFKVVQLRVLGGAIADIPDDATPYGHRRYPLMAHVVAMIQGEQDKPAMQAWIDGVARALGPAGNGAAYVNFVGDEGPERIRDAYPAGTLDRLRRIKAQVDPHNLFRLNQNIAPA